MSRWQIASILIVTLVLLAACRGENAPPAAAPPPATAPTAEPTLEPAAEAPTAEAEAVPTDDAADDAADVAPPPTAAPVEEADVADPAPDAPTSPSAVQTVEGASGINSYRMSIVTESSDGRAGGPALVRVLVEAGFVKEPPAQTILVDMTEGDQNFQIEQVLSDGIRYMRSGDMWIQSQDATLHLNELTIFESSDIQGLLPQMTLEGPDTIRGRAALRYTGTQDIIPVFGEPGTDTLDVSRADSARITVWLDEEFNVISGILLEAELAHDEVTQTHQVRVEYYDFNQEIDITVPESSVNTDAPPVVDVPAEELRGPVSQLLGFNLLLPTGSNIETEVAGLAVTATTPFTFEEAQPWLELNFQQAGYTQQNKLSPTDQQIVYTFMREGVTIAVVVEPDGNGGTRVQWTRTP